ncbi:MAG TPA: hypothetical protein VMT03_15855 [Polyangia bacterium]|nr:hypothetical protein [Polyangia bacterium]
MSATKITTILAMLILVAAAGAGTRAHAAEVTRVVSALDADDTWDFNLTATWLHDVKTAAVNVEQETGTGATLARDLKYAQTSDVLNLRVDFGVLWDVGLHVQAPLVLYDSNHLDYDKDVGISNSTFVGTFAGGDAATTPTGPGSRVFTSPTRKGFENLGLGVTWAVFNQRRDDTKPTWTLSFDALLDVFKDMRYDPASPNGNTAVGLGYHQLIWTTWVSKRFRHFDPFFGASYMLPIRTNGSIFQDQGGGQTAVNPQQVANAVIGLEVIAWENAARQQRVTVEARAHMEEHFAGRGYSELWEPLSGSSTCQAGGTDLTGCRASLDQVTQAAVINGVTQPTVTRAAPYPGVTDIEAYGSFGGDLGLNVQVGPYIRFRSLFGLSYDEPHFITNASPGVPGPDGRVDSNNPSQANPTYRESIDLPGRRFRVEQSETWHLVVEGALMF